MNFKKDKLLNTFFIILLITILILPKMNIIAVPGSRTGIRIDDICVLIYFIYFIYKYFIKKEKIDKRIYNILKCFGICILIFTIATVLGIIRDNVSPLLSFLHLIRNIEYFILIFAGYDFIKQLKNKDDLFMIMNYILVFHGIYMLLEYLGIIPDIGFLIGRPGNNRIYTTFSGPYEFSGYLAFILPIYILKVFKEKQYFNLLYIVIILLGIIISQSRISLLSAIIIIFIIFILEFKSKYKKKILIMGSILLLVLTPIILNLKSFERFKTIDISNSINTFKIAWENADFEYYKENGAIKYDPETLNSTTDLSYAIRISKWTTLLKESLKTPVFGLGLSISNEAADGDYVRIFAESGILGITAWFALMITTIMQSRKLKYNLLARANCYSILILLIIAAFIDVFVASKVMMFFWFVIGASFAYEDRKRKNDIRKKIKILHFVSGINFGGVESVLYNYFKNMKDIDNYENIIISHDQINPNDAIRFENIGFKFYEVTPKRKSLIKNIFEINSIIRKEKPDIVHAHMTLSSYIVLLIAYLNEVKIRICHAHVAENINFKNKIFKIICNCLANAYFACSKEAAQHMCLNKNMSKCYILKNAIDIERFQYNEETRKKIRDDLKITDKFVVGNIGRFSEQKNHKKIIDVFAELLKKDKECVLLLIGNGELQEKIQEKIQEKQLDKNVIILNSTTYIERYYCAMDVFIFPSLSEGFGMAVVEAQASGLSCIVSENVPKSVELTDLVRFVDLERSDEEWANIIFKNINYNRNTYYKEINKADFNIKVQADNLDKEYKKLTKKYLEGDALNA